MKECIQMATNPGYFTLNQLFRSCKEGFNWVMFNWIKPFQSCRKLWQDNRDRIIRLTVAWLIRSKTGFWPNLETSTAAVNAVKKDGDLVWPQCQGGQKYKFQCQQITINCKPHKSPLFCTPSYLGHNCLDCGSFWGLFATFSNYWLTSSIFHELPWH